MGLTTAQDVYNLDTWSWLQDYRRNKKAFIDVARIVYHVLTKHSGIPPNGPAELEQPLGRALMTCDIYKTLWVSKWHAIPALYPVFANLLARYILDDEWPNVIKP